MRTVETRIGVNETVGILPFFVTPHSVAQRIGQAGLRRLLWRDYIGPLLR